MIVEPAPAKINLALHVRRRRPDGYHDLETLFAFANYGDVIRVEDAARDSFAVTGPFAAALGHHGASTARASAANARGEGAGAEGGGAHGGDNLVVRARDAFRAAFGLRPVAITLEKNLPIASGIGGGSADAAATLRALARVAGPAPGNPGDAGPSLDASRLDAIARTLGADVPACLHGGTSFGTGRGDDLVMVAGMPGTPLLLVNPGIAVSTAAVFGDWDGIDRGAIGDGPLLDRARTARNDLEPPARAIAPPIDEVLALLAQAHGVLISRMSGSGATCFALFATDADRSRAAVAARTRGWWTMESILS